MSEYVSGRMEREEDFILASNALILTLYGEVFLSRIFLRIICFFIGEVYEKRKEMQEKILDISFYGFIRT